MRGIAGAIAVADAGAGGPDPEREALSERGSPVSVAASGRAADILGARPAAVDETIEGRWRFARERWSRAAGLLAAQAGATEEEQIAAVQRVWDRITWQHKHGLGRRDNDGVMPAQQGPGEKGRRRWREG